MITKTTRDKQEDQLYGELLDIELEMMNKLNLLIQAEWNAPPVKRRLEALNIQREKMYDELEKSGFFVDGQYVDGISGVWRVK